MKNVLIKDKLVPNIDSTTNVDSIADISTDDNFDDAGLNDDKNVDLDDDDDENNDEDDEDDDDDKDSDDQEGERNNINDGLVEVNLNAPCPKNRTFDDAYICNVPDASTATHTLKDNHLPLPRVSPSDHCNDRSHVSSTPSSN
ncbi:uncharacterized protein LOC133785857 [Humulus lupulus]|uniref:uncharacterized protein LOC133785857 n=1 Tax=Humulus lupulus TaxID=3486 RepID=UPI002B4084B1|nr:uncharacterized protein LOC133785857 [Humulus lupulus]